MRRGVENRDQEGRPHRGCSKQDEDSYEHEKWQYLKDA